MSKKPTSEYKPAFAELQQIINAFTLSLPVFDSQIPANSGSKLGGYVVMIAQLPNCSNNVQQQHQPPLVQVLAYDDPVTNEPRNDFIQEVYNLDSNGINLPTMREPFLSESISFRQMLKEQSGGAQKKPAQQPAGYERRDYRVPNV